MEKLRAIIAKQLAKKQEKTKRSLPQNNKRMGFDY